MDGHSFAAHIELQDVMALTVTDAGQWMSASTFHLLLSLPMQLNMMADEMSNMLQEDNTYQPVNFTFFGILYTQHYIGRWIVVQLVLFTDTILFLIRSMNDAEFSS